MSDISVKSSNYGVYAAPAAAPREVDFQPVGQPQERGGQVDTVMPGAVRAPEAPDVSLQSFEKMIDHYVPKELPNTRLQIEHDEGSGLFVYRAIDRDTGEVVRQYPADEILRFISYFRESEGLVVDGHA